MEIEGCADERWALVNSTENSVETQENGRGREEEEEDDDDDEALSLCDLPLIHHSRKDDEEYTTPLRVNETHHQEDFDFCSLSKESEMCAADDVFFQGQILPLRRSLSSSRSIRRSESMDHYFSGSRSSSISSHHSSTSGSGSSTATTDSKLPPINQFHSHPSPSPKVHFPRNRINSRNCTKKSSAWNVFRLGLVAAPPEIAFHDLKTRCPSKINLGNGSRSSDKRKIKPWDFLGGCKCSVDTVDAVPSKVVIIKRSVSDNASQMRVLPAEEESLLAVKPPKKRLSHRRTFEWLKQLSLEGTADEP